MTIVNDFFNKLASEIDKTYFPTVKYYGDDKSDARIHYHIELFNNGCLTYEKLIKVLSKECNETKDVIHSIVSKYIADFEGYIYK